MRSKYSNLLVWKDSNKDMREQLEPHVYEVSSLSYKGLAFGGENQSILVSGESGAGYVSKQVLIVLHIALIRFVSYSNTRIVLRLAERLKPSKLR
jgi:myosin heavy subunit